MLEREAFQIFCPLSNFQTLAMFSVFLGKKRKHWKKCSIRTALNKVGRSHSSMPEKTPEIPFWIRRAWTTVSCISCHLSPGRRQAHLITPLVRNSQNQGKGDVKCGVCACLKKMPEVPFLKQLCLNHCFRAYLVQAKCKAFFPFSGILPLKTKQPEFSMKISIGWGFRQMLYVDRHV